MLCLLTSGFGIRSEVLVDRTSRSALFIDEGLCIKGGFIGFSMELLTVAFLV